jgi:hypothetical protein
VADTKERTRAEGMQALVSVFREESQFNRGQSIYMRKVREERESKDEERGEGADERMNQTMTMQSLSYDDYRKHMEEVSYKKKQLMTTIAKKKEAHRVYRQAYKEYNELDERQEALTKELIELIPDAQL